MSKATKRQFLTSVSGISGYWRTWSGGGASAEYSRDYSGGSNVGTILTGPAEHEDITLVRTWDPAKDPAWANSLKKKVGRSWHTLTKQATDVNFTKVGKPEVYSGATLVGLTLPEGDAASSDSAEVTLVFAHNGSA